MAININNPQIVGYCTETDDELILKAAPSRRFSLSAISNNTIIMLVNNSFATLLHIGDKKVQSLTS